MYDPNSEDDSPPKTSISDDERIAQWNLWSVRGVTHRHLEALGRRGSIAELWRLDDRALERRIDTCEPGPKTRERLIERVSEGDPEVRYRREVEALPERASLLHLADAPYPPRLLALSDPPTFVYVWGDPEAMHVSSTLATVGSRDVDVDDARRTARIVQRVARANVAVVSGGANGVDTVAHRACLQADVPTVALMPGGLDQLTPKSNTDLFERISRQGAVVTEYPLGVDVRHYHFPRRNRLIAALGDATFVVRGDVDSGTMLTADAALEIGRPIGALVGGLDEPLAAGCLKLIVDEDVQAIRDGEDVLEHLLETSLERARANDDTIESKDAPSTHEDERSTDDDETEVERSDTESSSETRASAALSTGSPLPDELSDEANRLLDVATELEDETGAPLHVDRLARAADRTPDDVQSSLLELELYGLVSKAPGAQAYRFYAGE